MEQKIRVYAAVSLDGFLAGEDDELDWLGNVSAEGHKAPGTLDFEGLLEETGCLLMGRRTFEVVQGFDEPWPYGELPTLVATHRPLVEAPPTARPVSGDISSLCDQARAAAGGRDVYLDGGGLISQALDANLVDEMVLSIVPTLLGKGIALYQGSARLAFTVRHSGVLGEMVQLRLTPTS